MSGRTLRQPDPAVVVGAGPGCVSDACPEACSGHAGCVRRDRGAAYRSLRLRGKGDVGEITRDERVGQQTEGAAGAPGPQRDKAMQPLGPFVQGRGCGEAGRLARATYPVALRRSELDNQAHCHGNGPCRVGPGC